MASKQHAPGSEDVCDKLCAEAGIEHQLTLVHRPQTDGMMKRFKGRISEVLASRRFDFREDLENTPESYCHLRPHQSP